MNAEISLLKDILPIKRRLERLSQKDFDGISAEIKILEDILFGMHVHKEFDVESVVPPHVISFFRKAFCDYETALEEKRALEAITGKNVLSDRVLSRTSDYANAEGRMALIKKSDCVLVIGSGPFPETAITYSKDFGCNVTCLEKERGFCKISRELLDKIGLSDKIEVIDGNGENTDVSGFDKILVTVLTDNKAGVIGNLLSTDAEIIARTSFGSSRIIYEPIDDCHLGMFFQKGRLIRWGQNFTSTVFLEPR